MAMFDLNLWRQCSRKAKECQLKHAFTEADENVKAGHLEEASSKGRQMYMEVPKFWKELLKNLYKQRKQANEESPDGAALTFRGCPYGMSTSGSGKTTTFSPIFLLLTQHWRCQTYLLERRTVRNEAWAGGGVAEWRSLYSPLCHHSLPTWTRLKRGTGGTA